MLTAWYTAVLVEIEKQNRLSGSSKEVNILVHCRESTSYFGRKERISIFVNKSLDPIK